MDAAERVLLATTIADAIERAAPRGGPAVDEALDEIGWREVLGAEPGEAVAVVFRALGATNAAASVLDDVLACALGMEPRPDLAVVLPPFGAWTAPGNTSGGRVSALGLATVRASTAREMLVVGVEDGELSTTALPRTAVDIRPVKGLDPDAGFRLVRIDEAAGGASALDAGAWDGAVAMGRLAVAYQLAGTGRSMLDLAREHALERVQFDRPIARFQVVRHRLADALVALEALDATLAAAADEPGPLTAELAKAVAGRAAQTVGAHCQQVLAGIGFTTDHPFHRFLKRTMTLDGIFGTADDVALDVGRRLLADRKVPTLVEL